VNRHYSGTTATPVIGRSESTRPPPSGLVDNAWTFEHRRAMALARTLGSTAAVVVGAIAACAGPNKALETRLEASEQRVAELERRVGEMAEATQRIPEIMQVVELIAGRLAELEPGEGRGRDRPPRPDPAVAYSVPIAGDPFEGPAHAKVTIVEAYEFACPFCAKVRPTLAQLRAEYKDDVKIVYKHFIVHPDKATVPALAACAAQQQGKYLEMSALIWDKGFEADLALGRDNMEKLARKLRLDMKKFRRDLDGAACQEDVAGDQAAMVRVGTRGTPAFYINGRHLSGAMPIDHFRELIDEELAKANAAIATGAKLETYYDSIVASGAKSL
jgi:protein-disulfide isomerase